MIVLEDSSITSGNTPHMYSYIIIVQPECYAMMENTLKCGDTLPQGATSHLISCLVYIHLEDKMLESGRLKYTIRCFDDFTALLVTVIKNQMILKSLLRFLNEFLWLSHLNRNSFTNRELYCNRWVV